MTQPIKGFSGKYRFLSNFHPTGFFYGEAWCPTNEHYYQAMKTVDQEQRSHVLTRPTPQLAKRAGRHVTLRSDWDVVKDDVMMFGLKLKFPTGSHSLNLLLETGDAYLEETNTWGDTYWGVCDGEGENKLGLLLMKLRGERA